MLVVQLPCAEPVSNFSYADGCMTKHPRPHRSFQLNPRVISWRQPQWPTPCCKHPPNMKQTTALLILLSVVLVLHGSVNADRLSTSLHSPPPPATLSGTVVSSNIVSFVGSGQAATSIYSALLLAWPTSAAVGVQSSLRFKLARSLFKGTVFVPNDQASYGTIQLPTPSLSRRRSACKRRCGGKSTDTCHLTSSSLSPYIADWISLLSCSSHSIDRSQEVLDPLLLNWLLACPRMSV